MFSVASIATMTVCIFIFGVFFSILMNINSVVRTLEEEVGVTVLFDEGLSEDRIDKIGEAIRGLDHVTEVTFTSAEEAWENYQKEYLGNNTELAEGFSDNPLANSASYTVKVDLIENQNAVVDEIRQMEGVRQVNQSSGAVNTLRSFNRMFSAVSIVVIAILLVVSVSLISNTINVGISVRKDEIGIMKLIGATDAFVRAPFIVEGLVLGLIGAALPLAILYGAYNWLIGRLLSRFDLMSSMMGMLPSTQEVFYYLLPVSLVLGIGIGLTGSIITVRKHVEV